MSAEQASSRPLVVIVGGGIAGLEAALALADLAGERATLSLVSPEPDFLLKPMTVNEPFTREPAERHELEPALAQIGVEFVLSAVSAVDPAARTLTLARGPELHYDVLVVCVGGRVRPALEGVETFWSNRSDVPVDELIGRADDAGAPLTLVVPPGTSWPLPLYELALLIRRRSEELGFGRVGIRIVTPEDGALAIFGSRASAAVAELLEAREIEVLSGSWAIQDADGAIHVSPGEQSVDPGLVLALPTIEGPRVPGLPADEHGFIPVDAHGRVTGAEGVYAAGDGTNFPVKQGGLATQQADAAAEQIAAELGAAVVPEPFSPVLRGQLITGADSLHMRHGLAGGQGEGTASQDYLWWPPQKVGGRYLSPWLGYTEPADLEVPGRPLEVEVSWPHEWHGDLLSYDAEVRLS